MSTVYPLDVTGVLPANLITNEQQTVTAANYKDFAFLIPEFAPFYSESMQLTYRDLNGNVTPMEEGVHFLFAMPFVGASRATAKPLYGAIQFLNLNINGTITFTRYQTLGGNYTLDAATLTALMVDLIYNPRITTWEQIVALPEAFPPVPHAWDLINMVGMSAVDASLRAIVEAIYKSINNGQNDHFTNFFNPHDTDKNQINLGLVENYPPATLSQAIDGTSATAYMTPMVAKLAVSTLLAPVNLSIASLSTKVAGMDTRLSTAETNITNLRTDLTSLSTSTSTNRTSLSTALSSAITMLQTADATLQAGISSLSTSIGATNSTVASISVAQAANNTSQANSLTALQTQRNNDVTNLGAVDSSLQTQINSLNGTVTSHGGTLNNHETRIGNLESRMANAEGRLGGIDSFLAAGNLFPYIFNNVPCALWQAAAARCVPAGTGGPATGPVGGF